MFVLQKYSAIINNLNPLIFCQDPASEPAQRYLWINHESYGEKMSEYVERSIKTDRSITDQIENSLF